MAKHIPLRSCIACRETKPKRELVRVVRVADDRIDVDLTGKANGRGAYFCPAQECWELGRKRKALNHALTVSVSPDNWNELLAWAAGALPEKSVPTRVSPGGTSRARTRASRTRLAHEART